MALPARGIGPYRGFGQSTGFWQIPVLAQRRLAQTLAEFAGARETKGSWWPDWIEWIREQDSAVVPAKGKRMPGGRGDPVIEDAPGRYVKTLIRGL